MLQLRRCLLDTSLTVTAILIVRQSGTSRVRRQQRFLVISALQPMNRRILVVVAHQTCNRLLRILQDHNNSSPSTHLTLRRCISPPCTSLLLCASAVVKMTVTECAQQRVKGRGALPACTEWGKKLVYRDSVCNGGMPSC